jgi:hypothetical protein
MLEEDARARAMAQFKVIRAHQDNIPPGLIVPDVVQGTPFHDCAGKEIFERIDLGGGTGKSYVDVSIGGDIRLISCGGVWNEEKVLDHGKKKAKELNVVWDVYRFVELPDGNLVLLFFYHNQQVLVLDLSTWGKVQGCP